MWKVDQKTFRYLLAHHSHKNHNHMRDLLGKISLFKDLAPVDLNRFTNSLTPVTWKEGDRIVQKGEEGNVFYIIQEGKVKIHDIGLGDSQFQDQILGPGNWFGERIWEGGRLTADWIEAAFDARVGYPVRLYVRATSPTPARFGVAVDDVIVGSLDIPASRGRFVEVPVDLSSAVVRPGMRVRLTRREGEPVLLHLFACQRVER